MMLWLIFDPEHIEDVKYVHLFEVVVADTSEDLTKFSLSCLRGLGGSVLLETANEEFLHLCETNVGG